jgi:hypothetical protein
MNLKSNTSQKPLSANMKFAFIGDFPGTLISLEPGVPVNMAIDSTASILS